VGLPGSGKSTFAALLQRMTGGMVISTDRLRGELYGDAQVQGEWSEVETQVLARYEAAIAQGKTVIYDATNYQRAWRRGIMEKFQAIAPDPWIAWWLDVPLPQCLERNQGRSRQVPPDLIALMATHLAAAPPHPADGFIQVIHCLGSIQAGDPGNWE
jgi:predicted kinase